MPSSLQCILTYCDNATSPPASTNLLSPWDGQVVPLNTILVYSCKPNMAIESDTNFKYQAATSTTVKCGSDGLFDYPASWPQCSTTVSCPDPGISPGVNRTYRRGPQDLQYNSTLRYSCTDPRKYIKTIGSGYSLERKLETSCGWRQTFPLDGFSLECLMHHCSHPHDHPGAHRPPPPENNISLVTPPLWDLDDWHIDFGDKIRYQCDGSTHIENTEADPTVTEYLVECDPSGVYKTPEIWPNCTETVRCGQPPEKPTNGSINGVFGYDGSISWVSPALDLQDTYNTVVNYTCVEGSQFEIDSQFYRFIINRCLWSKAWDPHPSLPPCVVTHCTHPAEHNPPPAENNIALVVPTDWTNDTWEVGFGENIVYKCTGSRFFENRDLDRKTSEIDPTVTELAVACLTSGEYDSPALHSQIWPNCTETVNCGQPPDKPTNGIINGQSGFDGSISWLYGGEDLQDTYNTSVEYRCANGSQFLTDSGNYQYLRTRCQWNKQWAPYHDTLPNCVVTHCIQPFSIPEDSFLEELTSAWTEVGKHKQYRCQKMKQDGTHTMFWESDRSKSTFQMKCLPDGSFQFEDQRENWPTCLEGGLH